MHLAAIVFPLNALVGEELIEEDISKDTTGEIALLGDLDGFVEVGGKHVGVAGQFTSRGGAAGSFA